MTATTPHSRSSRAFTMTELLFVMAIMIALAGLTAGALGPVKNQIARQQTKTLIKALDTGLAAFQAEYGGYPICENLDDGSSILYKALFGDYNGNGIPDNSSRDLDDAAVQCFVPKLQPAEIDPETGEPLGSGYSMRLGDEIRVVDSWGAPVYYINYKAGTNSDAPRGGGKHNPTYDLWSLGNDSGEDESKWIKNW